MGSQQPLLAVAPQQELPPDFTRRAASPYFCLTTSLMSVVSVVLITQLLFADLNDVLRFESLIARAAFGVEELQQLLQSGGVRGVAKKRALALHFDQAFGPQFVEMMREGRVRDFEFALNV